MSSLPAGDSRLVQIVDAALAETARKSGDWLVCRAGCTPCCHGVFAISQLDVLRLQKGLEQLQQHDSAQADAIRKRAVESWSRLAAQFPGDAASGILATDEDAVVRFEDFANDEPCPVLSPETGLCELYEHRPMTCRVFGPPVKSEGGLGICELCYRGATPEQIAACEMLVDPDELEPALTSEAEDIRGQRGKTIIAFSLK